MTSLISNQISIHNKRPISANDLKKQIEEENLQQKANQDRQTAKTIHDLKIIAIKFAIWGFISCLIGWGVLEVIINLGKPEIIFSHLTKFIEFILTVGLGVILTKVFEKTI
ncbi:MAG: hypothetical protein GX568_05475 [Candidatus Gastranaerophilales bacterium]|nr:hypothetical protein [Candidatus Gastranaerophilales bacterium]